MTRPPQRIGLVCVHYYSDFIERTVHALNSISNATGTTDKVLVTNNPEILPALADIARQSKIPCEAVSHDNTGMEFGAYQAGLDRLLAHSDPDWVIFANDTFVTHHHFPRAYRQNLARELQRHRDHAVVVGQVDSIARSYTLSNLKTNRWIRSNLFALNRNAIAMLDRKLYQPSVDRLVQNTSARDAFFASGVGAVLREHIEAWLFGQRSIFAWYGAEPLSEKNHLKMANKARSILQEQYLSAKLNDQGAEFADLKTMSRAQKVLTKMEAARFRPARH